MNTDLIKLKILANRLSSFLKYINKDQVGFVKGRQRIDQIIPANTCLQ